MAGWVKLHRSLSTSAIASKPDFLSVWIHLLMDATHKPTSVLVGRQVVELEPGQMVFGRKVFSAKTGVSEAVIRSSLNALQTLQQITIKTTTKYSIISIVNWSKFQEEKPADDQQATSKQPASNHIQEAQELQEEIKSSRDQQAEHVPCAEIFDSYAKALPELPQLRMRDDARKKAIRSLWRMSEKFQTVDFWDRYFNYVRGVPFLMGMRGIGFDWLMKPANFKKVLEGNYQDA
jgi:hypothetical protein